MWAIGHGGAGEPIDLLHYRDGHDEHDTNLDWLVLSARIMLPGNECEKATLRENTNGIACVASIDITPFSIFPVSSHGLNQSHYLTS